MGSKLLILLVIVGIILVSGCTGTSPQAAPTGPTAPQGDAPTENKGITTVITPARDLTGEWEGLSGSAKWRDNVVNWACSYEGYFHLSLKQNGNNLVGTFTSTITKVIPNTWNTGEVPCGPKGTQPSAPLTGMVSSSSFKFTAANIIDFVGTFTSDLMQSTFESCPNQICAGGTRATGSIGEFKATRQK